MYKCLVEVKNYGLIFHELVRFFEVQVVFLHLDILVGVVNFPEPGLVGSEAVLIVPKEGSIVLGRELRSG